MAAVALVISVVALSATFMQVLQQYYASAMGYAECNEKVMGQWASTKSRRFSWHELRFEVEFDAPVIFVASPRNKNGPVPEAELFVMDGTQQSMEKSWTTSDMDTRKQYEKLSQKDKIHTADNERASWFVLLSAVQRMEEDSREWQLDQYKPVPPPNGFASRLQVPLKPATLIESHTLSVVVQKKRKSWDTMARSVAKPYATTTICHMIEMMAALGIYWKEFDRRRDRYRAEGNGFMVLGERLSDLGLCFSFSTYGKCRFEANRVIPDDDIKSLCFGYVPTIYRETLDQRRLAFPIDEPQNLSALQMASRSEIAETLVLIGCNNNTVRYYLDYPGVTSHLFPGKFRAFPYCLQRLYLVLKIPCSVLILSIVSFEIVGMLTRMFHIDDTCFTYLPNPTPDRWDKRSVSLVKLLQAYQKWFRTKLKKATRNGHIVRRFNKHMQSILTSQGEEGSLDRLVCLKALRAAISDTDEILTARTGASQPPRPPGEQTPSHNRNQSADITANAMPETHQQGRRREMVQDVLRAHIQEVLRLLNETSPRETVKLIVPGPSEPPSPRSQRFVFPPRVPGPRFQDMNDASPDDRQEKFMQVYFEMIRPQVVRSAKKSTTTRRESVSQFMTVPKDIRRRGSGQSSLASSSMLPRNKSPVPSVALHAMRDDLDGAPARRSIDVLPAPASPTLSLQVPVGDAASTMLNDDGDESSPEDSEYEGSLVDLNVSHEDIWCTLVFRMICWLMLHDFNKMDVQIHKSELFGSRMPVYIS